MIFRKMNHINELPENCTVCPQYPLHCSLPLEKGYLKDGLGSRRSDSCSLIEIRESDIEFSLNHAIENRDNSQALSEIPEQRWKILHKSEVEIMNGIISRFENIKKVVLLTSMEV